MNAALRPLEGLVVVALEQAVAAPFCTSRLADAGARVIKIERAEGDFARGYDAFAKGQSAYFVWLNRGKQSAVLDIKDPVDHAVLMRMLETADVFIQNLAPGAVERAGFGIQGLRTRFPRLIACSISGYGSQGPYHDRKAYDLLLQAETGMASITGTPDAPGRIGVSGCDIACGMYAHAAILQALVARGISGHGQAIEVSLFDAMADWMAVPLMQYDTTGRGPARVGLAHPSIVPYGVYSAGDGAEVLLAIQNAREWVRFCNDVLKNPDIAVDHRFETNIERVRHRHSLDAIITAELARYDRAGLLSALKAADLGFGMLNSVKDLAEHPHLRRAPIETLNGSVDAPAPPTLVNGASPALGAAPALGEHTEQLRAEYAG